MGWNSDRHEPNSWSAYGVSYDEISGEDHLFVAVRFDGEYKKYFVTHIALWSGAKRGGLTGWEPREMPATLPRHSIKTALPLAQLLSGIISLLERGDAKMKRAAKYLQHGRSALREKEESGANEVENALEILRAEYKNPQKFDSEAKRLSKGLQVSEHAILFEKLFGRKIHAGGEKQSKAKLVELIIRERRRRINFEAANAKGYINMTTATPVKTTTKFKTKSSMYETKPYYIIFAKTSDGDWEQGFGDYNKNVVIQERKDEITRDKGYKTGPLDWFIADFDAPKRGGPEQKVTNEFLRELSQGKFKIKPEMLVGKARILNVSTVYRMGGEEASFKEEAEPMVLWASLIIGSIIWNSYSAIKTLNEAKLNKALLYLHEKASEAADNKLISNKDALEISERISALRDNLDETTIKEVKKELVTLVKEIKTRHPKFGEKLGKSWKSLKDKKKKPLGRSELLNKRDQALKERHKVIMENERKKQTKASLMKDTASMETAKKQAVLKVSKAALSGQETCKKILTKMGFEEGTQVKNTKYQWTVSAASGNRRLRISYVRKHKSFGMYLDTPKAKNLLVATSDSLYELVSKAKKAKLKETASDERRFSTKPYYIIFAKDKSGGWEQGWGGYDKGDAVSEAKTEYNRDKGYIDWFIAEFEAPRSGGPSQKITDAFQKDLDSGKLKITKADLVGKSRTFNVASNWGMSSEASSKKPKSIAALSPWNDNSSLDDVLDKSLAGSHPGTQNTSNMPFKFSMDVSWKLLQKLGYAEEGSFEDHDQDPEKRPLINVLKRSQKGTLKIETYGELADLLYSVNTGLFGDSGWDSYTSHQSAFVKKLRSELKKVLTVDDISKLAVLGIKF